MPKRRRSSTCLGMLLLLVIALGLLLVAVFATSYLDLPKRVEDRFGPPASGLSLTQRIRYSVQLLWQSKDLTEPVNPLGKEQSFKIKPGESTALVIQDLADNGLIRNPEAFRSYLLYSGLDTGLQPGSYSLSPALTPIEIAHKLHDRSATEVKFNVLAGWRVEEIAAQLPTSGLVISSAQFEESLKNHPAGYSFSEDLPPEATLEGFLFPDEYTFSRKATADDLVKAMLDNFDRQVTAEMRQGFVHQGLNLYQAVTLASILEREAIVHDEMPLLASVYLNRLKIDMKLDADPTVQFALGYDDQTKSWWKNPLALDDLKVDSPYNTYLYPNLPPGPIANPSLSALRAVAFPAQTRYYYFRAACDGSGRHVFAETYEQHVKNGCP